MDEPIVRIAARGDGVTPSGRHVQFGVPGDALLDDGALAPGPHHQVPPCRHFPECGGCQLQHADDEAYRSYLSSRVETALAQHGLTTVIREPHLSPPRSRRRATLKAVKVTRSTLVGFNEEKSHRIVDMHECHILRPELFSLVARLRELFQETLQPRRSAEAQLTLVNEGVDLLVKGLSAQRLDEIELLVSFARQNRLARLSLDQGLGPETLYEPVPATVTLGSLAVPFPIGGFLQATKDGEQALVGAIREALGSSKAVADLFAGIGTFALATQADYAAEASRDAIAALRQAAPSIRAEHRDLYRRPLNPMELTAFEAVILDPPRAGAEEQVRELSRSNVSAIAYVSCNPSTFARDSAILVHGGYGLEWVKPVGQFRWSTHVELAGAFIKRP